METKRKTVKNGRRGNLREFYKTSIVRFLTANTVSIGGKMHRVRLSAFIYKKELFGSRSEKLSFFAIFSPFSKKENGVCIPLAAIKQKGERKAMLFFGANGASEGNDGNARGI